jgi:hypothetical protein
VKKGNEDKNTDVGGEDDDTSTGDEYDEYTKFSDKDHLKQARKM